MAVHKVDLVRQFRDALKGASEKDLAGFACVSPAIHFATFVRIYDKSNQLIRPRPNILQIRMSQVYEQCQAWGIPVRMIVCKPRQVGCSTFAAHICYHHEQRFRTTGITIADVADNSIGLMKKVADYGSQDEFPWGHRMKPYAKRLKFSNGSVHEIDSAENWKAGISVARQLFHACLGVGTPVVGPSGKLRSLGSLKVGDKVRTHTGKVASISYISEQIKPAFQVKLRGMHSFPLISTEEHRFWTKEGFKTLGEIMAMEDGHIGFPVEQVTNAGHVFQFALPAPVRPQGGGIVEDVPDWIVPSYALGKIVGLYLAEGCISRQRNKHRRPTALIFTVHEREVKRTLEWLEEISPMFSRVRAEKKGGKSVNIVVSGRSLTEWMLGFVGEANSKRFPDRWREMGECFVRGIVHGYVSGDGHCSPKRDRIITVTSIRSATVIGLRDALASLGYGWSSISYKEAAIRHGRNEKEAWILSLCGTGVDKLAGELGLETPPRLRHGNYGGAEISNGYAWVPISSVKPAGNHTVRDLEIDHEDHSYCILHGATHNSEIGKWPKSGVKEDKRVMAAVLPSVAKTANSLVIAEGTPDGASGWMYDTWTKEAVTLEELAEMRREGRAPGVIWIKVFAAWFEFEEHQHDGKAGRPGITKRDEAHIQRTMSERERRGIALYGWSLPQIAWRRAILSTECNGDEDLLDEYYAEDPESCFLVSGRPRFDMGALTTMERLSKGMKAERGYLTRQEDGKSVVWSRDTTGGGDVAVWEFPREGMRYLISVDPMTGADQTRGRDPDRHAIGVLRDGYVRETGESVDPMLVARVSGPNGAYIADSDEAAGQIIALSRFYGGAIVVLEVNMGLHILELLKFEGVSVLQREVFDHKSGHKIKQYGFKLTNRDERRFVIDALATAIRTLSLVIPCPHALKECKDFVTAANGKDQARPGSHDDDVFMLGMGYLSLSAATRYRPEYRRRREPRDRKDWRAVGKGL